MATRGEVSAILEEPAANSEELAEQEAQAKELEALRAQLSTAAAGSANDSAAGQGDDDDDDDDLLGDTDALLAAATASAAKARAAAEQAQGVDVSKSAAEAKGTLASARASAQDAAAVVANSSAQQAQERDNVKLGTSSSAGADASAAQESGSDDDEDSATRQSVLTNANWDERLRSEREAEVMEIIKPIVEKDAEKLSFFKQASKMFRSGSVTAQQFMTALTKLFGGATARRVIPLLADAVPDADRRAELHDAFRAAERAAAVARASSKGGRTVPTHPLAAAATVPGTAADASQATPNQPLFSVPSQSTAPPSTGITFGSPQAGGGAGKPAQSAARQALFADDEAPAAAAPPRATEELEVEATALPTTSVSGGGGSTFDPLSAPPAPKAAPASAVAMDPLAAPVAAQPRTLGGSHSDPLSAPQSAVGGASHSGGGSATAAGNGNTVNAFASAQGEGRAAANGVGTPGAASSAPGAGGAEVAGGGSGVFSGLFAAPAHLREGITVDGGADEEEGGSIVASCPHDGGQLTVAMWDTMSQSDDSGRTFTLYALRCTWVRENRKIQWLVGRRYSEFELLRSSLSATLQHHPQCANRIMPPLPGKTLFGSNSDTVVSERRTKLAVFLSQLFQTFPIVLRTTEMDSFLKVTPRIGAIVNEFLERQASDAAPSQDVAAPAVPDRAAVPASAQYFLMLHTPVLLNLEHLNRHAVRLCSVFKAMVQRPPVLNGFPPSRDQVLQETARAAEVAQRCLEVSAAAATDESQTESLQLGGATVDSYLTQVLECQDRLQWCTAELASLQASAVAAGVAE